MPPCLRFPNEITIVGRRTQPVPFLIALAALLGVVLLAVALMPVSLVMRYRRGTARRLARGAWAGLNVAALGLSAALFLATAAVTSVWVPRAFTYGAAGLGVGCVLGVLGLLLTRWEPTPGALYYTPNRGLVLAVTLVVTARVTYGFWRAWHAWRDPTDSTSWLAAFGLAESMAAGAVVLGYYLAYGFGVWRRLQR